MTMHVPFRLVKRGGRKEMILPPDASAHRKTNHTLVKALARSLHVHERVESRC